MKQKSLCPVFVAAAVFLSLGVLPPAVSAQAAVDVLPEYQGASTAIPGRYIVVFKDQVTSPAAEARSMMRQHGGEIHHIYSHALQGFAATIPDSAYNGIRMNPNVLYIEQDITMFQNTTATQTDATWGLDRSDQRSLPLDSVYDYNHAGAAVRAYVIDSGINFGHDDFGGRAIAGYDAFPEDGLDGDDCNGHGTHVAGSIGSATWGVAKQVGLVSVRVFSCSGSTALSTVISGVDWVTGNGAKPAVVNMSLGGGFSRSLNRAVAKSVREGFVYSVAAGNDGSDACNYSPSSSPDAVTVGATQSNDDRAAYSNVGDCIDLFAPGSGITSTWIGSSTATRTISGTSMSAPHVAGVAALLLEQVPDATPAAVGDAIMSGATQNIVGQAHSTNNDLIYSLVTLEGGNDDGGSGDDDGGDSALSGSATKNGPSWTATVTLSGAEGDSTSGSWSTGLEDGCTIASTATNCSFSISNPNRVGSVSYSDDHGLGTVTIDKP